VHLTDPAAEWTVNSAAVLEISAVGGNLAAAASVIGRQPGRHGQHLRNSIWGARTDISGTVNVAAAGSFNLRAETSPTPTARSGAITGTGVLQSLTNTALTASAPSVPASVSPPIRSCAPTTAR